MAATPRDRSLAHLGEVFLANIYSIPGGEKIKECIQCGTCSGSCPTSDAMDYTPRQVIAALRAGMLDLVLKSNTVWMCASCYSCTARCPSAIKFTDIMYELKRLGIKYGAYQRGAKSPLLSKEFIALINRDGRSSETELMARVFLQSNPLSLAAMAPLGLNMLSRGRLPLVPERISEQGRGQIKKMLDWCAERGER